MNDIRINGNIFQYYTKKLRDVNNWKKKCIGDKELEWSYASRINIDRK